ncbi:MAG: biotin transporter BioY [Thermodesulfovibrionales bacterium]
MDLGCRSNALIDELLIKRCTTLWQDVALSFLGSIFIALSAQISIPLPFTPVPITGQTFAVLMTGILLGSKRGLMSVIFYLTEGAMGMPVFAGGVGGFQTFLGPTGGYLIGFAPSAMLSGYLVERGWAKGFFSLLMAMIISNAIIYVFGLTHLCFYTPIEKVLYIGFYPFIIGDFFKILLIVLSTRAMCRFSKKN